MTIDKILLYFFHTDSTYLYQVYELAYPTLYVHKEHIVSAITIFTLDEAEVYGAEYLYYVPNHV